MRIVLHQGKKKRECKQKRRKKLTNVCILMENSFEMGVQRPCSLLPSHAFPLSSLAASLLAIGPIVISIPVGRVWILVVKSFHSLLACSPPYPPFTPLCHSRRSSLVPLFLLSSFLTDHDLRWQAFLFWSETRALSHWSACSFLLWSLSNTLFPLPPHLSLLPLPTDHDLHSRVSGFWWKTPSKRACRFVWSHLFDVPTSNCYPHECD